MPEAWASALAHCTLDDLARCLERCERDDGGRLPTLGQIRAMCREYQPGTFAGGAPQHEPTPALPDLMSRSRTGRAWMALMQFEGHLPRGETTDEELLDALEGFDVGDMRRRHEQARAATLARMG